MSVLQKGTVLAQTYEIVEEIGAGGGGIVYRAKHLRLQTDVVVKKIKDEVRGKVKSRQEADILKNLKHPYLPRIYDFIETDDGVYTVIDFIHGENLGDAVKRHGKYAEKQVRKWAEQLGEALDYLHSQKPAIIHSDIKPANIMLTKDDNVCLIDFNISLAMGGTMESAVGLSAGYSPPEQYRDPALYERITHNYTQQRSMPASGRSSANINARKNDDITELQAGTDRTELLADTDIDKTELLTDTSNDRTELLVGNGTDQTEWMTGTKGVRQDTEKGHTSKYIQYIGRGIDTRSDIYSLGITLYFMLTGIEPPADFEQRAPLAEMNVFVNEGFAILLEKMIEPDPTARYQNGGEFLKAIRNCHKLDHRYLVMHRKETGMRIASLACLCLGILAVFCGLYQIRRERNSAYYGFLQQAVEAMNQYDYEDAEVLLEEAKEISQERIDAYEEEVHLLYVRGDYEECISRGENYINTMPFQTETEETNEQLGDLYYLVGNAYFETQDYANAAKLFSNALEYYTENGLYYRDYALALAKMGQVENAEQQLELGVALGLGEDSIYMAQGEIAHVRGQYETAAEYLEQTIEITDDLQMKKKAIFLCVDIYRTMGDAAVDDEIGLLEQYAGQFEGNGNLTMTEYLAEAYTRKAKVDGTQAAFCYDKALALFLSVYEQGYITYQVQENIAILYENLKEYDKAEVMFLEMTESYPERYEVYKRLAYLEADKQQEKENIDRDYQQMLSYYEKAKTMYEGKEQDMEMEMLDVLMQDVRDGGWL
ncbi:MAG: protein kinase [Lachnospiraceae bacterium]|nr:protein kinase [Lachnospiraceae bacterium]